MATICDYCGRTCGRYHVAASFTGTDEDGARINEGHVHFHSQTGTAPDHPTMSCYNAAVAALFDRREECAPTWKSGELRENDHDDEGLSVRALERIPTLAGAPDGPATLTPGPGTDLGELRIGTRAFTALRRANLLTIKSVVDYERRADRSGLRGLWGIGRVSYVEILGALREFGHELEDRGF